HVEVTSRVEIGAVLDVVGQELAQLASCHEAGGDLCHRNTGGFGDIGHCARGARIHLEDVHFPPICASCAGIRSPARNGEFNIHQSDDLQRTGQFEGVVTHAIKQWLRNVNCGQHARRIAGVNAGFFDVLHNSADDDVFAVGERVDIDFDCVFEEVVNKHGTVM